MQLIIISFTLFLFVLTQDVKAQLRKVASGPMPGQAPRDTTEVEVDNFIKPDWQTIDIDFLSSYYSQDGNNSPVTGGLGTEQLTDFTQKVILSVPVSPKMSINTDAGYDYYSSASTDNIDNIRSSDSASDMRVHGNIGLNYNLSDTKSLGFRIGGSAEYDYFSMSGGVNANILSKDRNTALQLGLQAFIDRWEIIYPSELRRTSRLPTDRRNSYNASLGLSQVINKKMQLQIQLEGTYMNGLLSTPFHRVYFRGQEEAKIEMLPDTRLKIPIGIRLNTHISEKLISRVYYRYYRDSWGMQGHTASIELPFKINRFFSVYPFYRYHIQSAADHFKPYAEHDVSDQFYTSDFDLAALSSHSYGAGLSYSPANGLARLKIPFTKNSQFVVKSIDLKYSHYDRSTGLKADIISIGFSFSL